MQFTGLCAAELLMVGMSLRSSFQVPSYITLSLTLGCKLLNMAADPSAVRAEAYLCDSECDLIPAHLLRMQEGALL